MARQPLRRAENDPLWRPERDRVYLMATEPSVEEETKGTYMH